MNHFVWLMFLFLECVYFGFFSSVVAEVELNFGILFEGLLLAFCGLTCFTFTSIHTCTSKICSAYGININESLPVSVQPFTINAKTATEWKYRNPFWSNWKLIQKQTSITQLYKLFKFRCFLQIKSIFSSSQMLVSAPKITMPKINMYSLLHKSHFLPLLFLRFLLT